MLLEDPHEADVWSRNSSSFFQNLPLSFSLFFASYILFSQSHSFYISTFMGTRSLSTNLIETRLSIFSLPSRRVSKFRFPGAFLDCELLSSPVSTTPRIMLLRPCVLSPFYRYLPWRSAPVSTFPNYARESSVAISLINVPF